MSPALPPLRAVRRDPDDEQSVVVIFDRQPTNDELQRVHRLLRDALAGSVPGSSPGMTGSRPPTGSGDQSASWPVGEGQAPTEADVLALQLARIAAQARKVVDAITANDSGSAGVGGDGGLIGRDTIRLVDGLRHMLMEIGA